MKNQKIVIFPLNVEGIQKMKILNEKSEIAIILKILSSFQQKKLFVRNLSQNHVWVLRRRPTFGVQKS